MEEAPRGGSIQLAVVLRFVDIATDALSGAREEIDALNVYPVPDGDTGTNMYLTMSAARDAIREAASGQGEARAQARTRWTGIRPWPRWRAAHCSAPVATRG